jgi:hypothetical protein
MCVAAGTTMYPVAAAVEVSSLADRVMQLEGRALAAESAATDATR